MTRKTSDSGTRIGEDALIARFFSPLATSPGAYGLTDDAASLIVPEGQELITTLDTLVAGVHFRENDPPDLIARKALRVNLSDLAAKAAEPIGYFLSLALNADWTEAWLGEFVAGLGADQQNYGISLYGGDTVMTPGPLTISLTAFGTVPAGQMIRRGTAKIGDHLFVSGTIGDAALGLRVGEAVGQGQDYLRRRYLVPEPRLDLRRALGEVASAAMDISDGMLGDLAKMCAASGVGAAIDRSQIPLSDATANALEFDLDVWDLILTGGDDYEILAAVPPDHVDRFQELANLSGIVLSPIGMIEAEDGVRLFDGSRKLKLPSVLSFEHF
jgi:thiamine-monophosphate kinase